MLFATRFEHFGPRKRCGPGTGQRSRARLPAVPARDAPEDAADGREPFTVLIDALEREGKPSLSWVTAYAPAGDLRYLWDSCNDPVALLYLFQRVAGVSRAAEVL